MLLYRFDRARAVKSSRTPLLCGYYGLLANRVFLVCGHSLPHINIYLRVLYYHHY